LAREIRPQREAKLRPDKPALDCGQWTDPTGNKPQPPKNNGLPLLHENGTMSIMGTANTTARNHSKFAAGKIVPFAGKTTPIGKQKGLFLKQDKRLPINTLKLFAGQIFMDA
jgi:hypothetical protein